MMAYDKILLVPKVGGAGINAAKELCTRIKNDERFKAKGILVTYDDSKADENTLIVPVGGDGTVLHAAKRAAENESTILGINLGNVGFLADLQADNAIETLLTINDNDIDSPVYWYSDERILVTLHDKDLNRTQHVAFNEFAVSDSMNGKMIGYDLIVNMKHAGYHRANGVLIATPTGSTGYSLSAGGPIITPDTEAFAITPVAPISLSSRSLIVGSNSAIILEITHPRTHMMYPRNYQKSEILSSSLVIKADGQPLTDYMMKDFISSYTDNEITYCIGFKRAPKAVKMIHPTGYNYFSILKEKLGWNS
jgi:NAD+ kinase